MNKSQVKAKKKRVALKRQLRARGISEIFGRPKLSVGAARTMEEYEANGGRMFK